MSLTENIISGALLLTILIAVGAIITSQSVETTYERIEFRQTSFMLDKHEGSINTIMMITEPETRQSYARLLARSIYENNDAIELPSGEKVNISDLINDSLRMVFGTGNYYAQITPFISDVHIRIVFDGTGSLDAEREVINENLEKIIEETREEAANWYGGNAPDITFKVYIVTGDDSLCDDFTHTYEGLLPCETIPKTLAYHEEFGEPWIEDNLNTYFGTPGEEVYYRGDWAAGLARSITNLVDEDIDYSESLILLFPVTDEMTTGSVPDECYLDTEPIRTSSSDLVTGWNAFYCGLCHEDCPDERSQIQIERLNEYIEQYDGLSERIVISGVFSKDCDTPYGSDTVNPNHVLGAVQSSGYIDDFIDEPEEYNPGDGNTFCDFDACRGCTTNPNDPTRICWRSSCTQATIEQLDDLSERYGGITINLEHVDQLPGYIVESVGRAAGALVTSYGERRDEDSRYVVTYSILLPNNERVPFTVWIYEDRVFDIHVPEIEIHAEPPEAWPGQIIRLLSTIETSGGVANVRITPESEDEPIELELLTRTSTAYTYYTTPDLDTTGLLDGTYDVAYEVYDTAFNRFEGTAREVFTIDSNLRPYPEIMNENVILQDVVLENRNAYAIVGIITDPDAAKVEAVWIEVVDRNGNTERYDLEFTIYWTTSFDVGSIHGTHYVSVFIEDDLGRIRTYTSIDSFEVVERLACESRDTCIDQGAGLIACTGDEQYDYYCSEEQAPEGMFAAERQSCQSGLGWDSNTHECYEPTTTYDFVFVPLRYSDTPAGRTAFTNAVNVVIQGLEQHSPINQCDSGLRDRLFKYHIVEDYTCYTRHGCTSTNPSGCLDAALYCGEEAFPGVGDKFYGISSASWGSLQGRAAYFGSPHMITAQQSNHIITRNVALHEAGHTWYLGHLRTGVPSSGGPCRNDYPNRADCDHSEEVQFFMNYALTSSNKRFGPAGYSVIASQLSEQLGYCS